MKPRKIHITTFDREKLKTLLDDELGKERLFSQLNLLNREIERAVIVTPDRVPPDVVTMNTRVKVRDLDTHQTFAYRLVYPSDADPGKGYVSVMAPIGMALLGYGVNDVIEWPVPAGIARLRIEEVLYQPEAHGVDRH